MIVFAFFSRSYVIIGLGRLLNQWPKSIGDCRGKYPHVRAGTLVPMRIKRHKNQLILLDQRFRIRKRN